MRVLFICALVAAMAYIAHSDGMGDMAIAALGPDCEDLWKKIQDATMKYKEKNHNWVTNQCKKCKGGVTMAVAWKHHGFLFRFIDAVFKFLENSGVKLDIFKMCPQVITRKGYENLVDKIMDKCIKKMPILEQKDICNMKEDEDVKKHNECVKKVVNDFMTPKMFPPPMHCLDNLKPKCDPKYHAEIVNFVHFFQGKMFQLKAKVQELKDDFKNKFPEKLSMWLAMNDFFSNSCKPIKSYTSMKMPWKH